MTKLIAMLSIAGIAGAQAPSAPSDPHPGERAVIVDVLVRNKTGPVSGLTKDDFTLQDKGKPQTIAIFAPTEARDPSAKPSPLSPLVGNNKVTRQGLPIQAATVVLYDRLNTPAADQAFVRKQVLAALSKLPETATFAFYSLGRSLAVVHDFTEDPASLIHAAERLSAAPPQPPPANPADQTMQKALEDALQPEQGIDMLFRVATTTRAFQSITRHLAGLPGRKSIAWITRTFPLTFGADVNRREELVKELNAFTETLLDEDVALYSLNPGGVGKGYKDNTTSNTDQAQVQEGQLLTGANASIAQDSGTLSDNSTMEDVAHTTGGLAFYNLNEIASKVNDVIADGDLTYSLGFYPTKLDGKAHDFGVKVKASGATLRFRKKYLAAKEDLRLQTPPIPQLAADPLEATAIALVAAAQPDPAHPGSQKVDVSVNLNDLTLQHAADRWTGTFEMGLSINGTMGATGAVKVYKLNLTDDQFHQAQRSGLIVSNTIDTGNQPVYLRAIVRDNTSGSAGAVHVPLPSK
ncbi:MAG: VWA domain-containing protein [Acidobacteriia bacterium]|nr:VWA domain-containing protein [Terriglobia bacterium]